MLHTLGQVYLDLGGYDRAVPLLEEAVGIAASRMGEESQPYYRSLSVLAEARWKRGDRGEPVVQKRRAIAIAKKLYGENDQRLSYEMTSLAQFLAADKETLPEAIELYREGLRIDRMTGTPEKEISATLANLASTEMRAGKMRDAHAHFTESLEIQRRVLPPLHPDLAVGMMAFGVFLKMTGDFEGAQAQDLEAREKLEKIFGPTSHQMGVWMSNYAKLLEAKGDADGAAKSYDESIAILAKVLGENHPSTQQVRLMRAQLRPQRQ